jgi:3-deoxy-D-manno-octulosonic-acid transferase
MHRKDFLLYQYALLLLRWCLTPFLVLIFAPLLSSLKKRLNFEKQNVVDPLSAPWGDRESADVAFEVSSEGEFEQVLPLLNVCLENGQKVELFYSSPSLEIKTRRFAQKYPKQVRRMRMPLLACFPWPIFGGQNFFKMVTAKKLILCRYDFYPELLIYGSRKDVEFMLVSATLKGKEKGLGTLYYDYFKALFHLFDLILTATEVDEQRFKALGLEGEKILPFDLRVLQIKERVQKSEETLSKFSTMTLLRSFIESQKKEKRVLMGSCWPKEMSVFSDAGLLEKISQKKLLFLLAPHKLDRAFLLELKNSFEKYSGQKENIPFYFIDLREGKENWDLFLNKWEKKPGPVVLTTPAVLLEMYTFFHNVFVGGGHGRSIHSVLEPFLAGAQVFCGPKTYRSTEFDLIQDIAPKSIFIVQELRMFASILLKEFQNAQSLDIRETFISTMSERFWILLKYFGLRTEEKCWKKMSI